VLYAVAKVDRLLVEDESCRDIVSTCLAKLQDPSA
jgi:hypothetical protein